MAHRRTESLVTIKKYSNRRLYDTVSSRYITLDELAERIRGGDDVLVVDAKTGEDLTQVTLAQIVIESRGAARLLPSPLLVEMIRMGDGALAEFLGSWMLWALQIYGTMRRGARGALPMGGFLPGMPGLGAWNSWFAGPGSSGAAAPAAGMPPPPRPHTADAAEPSAEAPAEDTRAELDALRAQLAALEARLGGGR
ncbi:MAG: hypothetical protein RIT45_1202 [Pseudomonadota bacterium]